MLHTFSSVKFKNVKINLRKFLNDHHIINKVYIVLQCFTYKTMQQKQIFKPFEPFVSVDCTSCLEIQSPSMPLN